MVEIISEQQLKQFSYPQQGEVISYQNINYYIGEYIGNGAFGAVYACSDDWVNNLVAKIILPREQTYEQVKNEWLHELNNLVQLRHPNITYVHSAFEFRDTFYLIVERCDSTLQQLIMSQNFNGEVWLPYIARDILHGLDYIHKNGYVHKDLHVGNIFVSKQFDFMVPTKDPVWSFKIGDLGISNVESNMRLFNTIMAPWMLPPEFLDMQSFGAVGKHIDIYHVGLLLLSLLLNQSLSFSHEEILAGKPRQMAENSNSRYSAAIAKSLRRHVSYRTQSAIEMWRDISNAIMQNETYIL